MAEEQLIVVDERNRAVGFGGKTPVHRAGLLHRAFSIFLVDDKGRILLQRRSRRKYHSGGLWANSCCGHPRPGEQTLPAARRRLREELGAEGPLSFGFFSRYRAELDGGMQENEFVYVYFGPLSSSLAPDPTEVSDVEFVSVDDLRRRVAREPDAFAYWLKHYLRNHLPDIAQLSKRAARKALPAADADRYERSKTVAARR
ncbi:MAG: isopentenyl-diphosphate Delta-isomerase [Xanthobacteraceae bacterium]